MTAPACVSEVSRCISGRSRRAGGAWPRRRQSHTETWLFLIGYFGLGRRPVAFQPVLDELRLVRDPSQRQGREVSPFRTHRPTGHFTSDAARGASGRRTRGLPVPPVHGKQVGRVGVEPAVQRALPLLTGRSSGRRRCRDGGPGVQCGDPVYAGVGAARQISYGNGLARSFRRNALP